MIYKGAIYEDGKGRKFLVENVVEKRLVITKPLFENNSYQEYTSFSENLDSDLKEGRVGFSYSSFERHFTLVSYEAEDVVSSYLWSEEVDDDWTEEELMFPFFLSKFGYEQLGRLMATEEDVQKAMMKVIKKHKVRENVVSLFRNVMKYGDVSDLHIPDKIKQTVLENRFKNYYELRKVLKEASQKINQK